MRCNQGHPEIHKSVFDIVHNWTLIMQLCLCVLRVLPDQLLAQMLVELTVMHRSAVCTSGGGPDQVPDAIARAASQETPLASVTGRLEHGRFSTNSLVTTL